MSSDLLDSVPSKEGVCASWSKYNRGEITCDYADYKTTGLQIRFEKSQEIKSLIGVVVL